MKKFIIALTCLLPLVISACNTVEGAGEDIEKGGKSIQRSAERHK